MMPISGGGGVGGILTGIMLTIMGPFITVPIVPLAVAMAATVTMPVMMRMPAMTMAPSGIMTMPAMTMASPVPSTVTGIIGVPMGGIIGGELKLLTEFWSEREVDAAGGVRH